MRNTNKVLRIKHLENIRNTNGEITHYKLQDEFGTVQIVHKDKVVDVFLQNKILLSNKDKLKMELGRVKNTLFTKQEIILDNKKNNIAVPSMYGVSMKKLGKYIGREG